MPNLKGTRGVVRYEPPYDRDAANYFINCSITSPRERLAVNTFIVNLKVAGMYSKISRLWLFSPTSAAAALRDFKVNQPMTNFNSSPWSTSGYSFNGTTQFLSTATGPNAVSTATSGHYAINVVTTTTPAANSCLIGSATDATYADEILLEWRTTPGFHGDYLNTATNSSTSSLAAGMYTLSRVSSTNMRIYQETTQIAETTSTVSGSVTAHHATIGTLNTGGSFSRYTAFTVSFVSMGSGLTAEEVARLATLNRAYQSDLGRV